MLITCLTRNRRDKEQFRYISRDEKEVPDIKKIPKKDANVEGRDLRAFEGSNDVT